jgi:ABC-type phosphate/phosphonate transport system substrate-binding protein
LSAAASAGVGDAKASLPMYLSAPSEVEALWAQLQQGLAAHGLRHAPPLSWPFDLGAHWRDPDLLLSQTCGYPLMTQLAGQVRLVGTFHYAVQGCHGHLCRSQLLARAEDGPRALADFRGRTVAYNSTDSQSGYNSLRALVAPLADHGRFFAAAVASGGHRQSLEMVRDGQADLTAVDCISLAGFQAHAPDVCAGLVVIGQSAPYPGLPLITSTQTSDADLAALRAALSAAVQSPALAPTRQALFISGFDVVELTAYQVCLDMQQEALALGYPAL